MRYTQAVEGLKRTGQNIVPVAIGDIVTDLINKGIEKLGVEQLKNGVGKIIGGIAMGVASGFVDNPTARTILQIGGAVGIWEGAKELAKSKGLYKFEPEVTFEVTPTVEVIPEEERRREEIQVFETGSGIEVA